MLSPTQGMLLSTRTPTHRSRFLYWIEDIFTVLASTYSTLNEVISTHKWVAAPPRPTPIPVLVGSYGSERTQPSFPRWRRGPETIYS